MGMGTTLRDSLEAPDMSPRPAEQPDQHTWLGRVAQRLKELRIAANLDVEQAAAAISKAGYELSAPTLYKWEQGRTTPHLSAFPAIAKTYRVSLRSVLPRE